MSFRKHFVMLLMLALILILVGCLSNFIPTTPSVNPPEGKAGVFYLEPANLILTPSQDFTVELMNDSVPT